MSKHLIVWAYEDRAGGIRYGNSIAYGDWEYDAKQFLMFYEDKDNESTHMRILNVIPIEDSDGTLARMLGL